MTITFADGPETTQIVVFAQVFRFSENRKIIRLCVGRITPRLLPPQTQPRAPRPDDPIPRKPPTFFIRDLKRVGSVGRDLKRVASGSSLAAGPLKRQKTLNTSGIAADLGSGVRLGAVDVEADRVFKVPELPKQARVNAKGKEKESDVFGDVSEVQRATTVKGKQKSDETQNEAAFEKANKNVSPSLIRFFLPFFLQIYLQAVKRSTIEYLARTKDPTNSARCIDKTHPDFKELYGFVYRGVCFALVSFLSRCIVLKTRSIY